MPFRVTGSGNPVSVAVAGLKGSVIPTATVPIISISIAFI
jgi:hypothetical protein